MFKKALLVVILISISIISIRLATESTSAQVSSPAPSPTVCSTSGSDVVLVIDRSGSMTDPGGTTGTKMSNAKSAARRFVDILAKDTRNRVGLSSFSTQATIDQIVTANYAAVKTEITNLTAGGDTCAECGVYKGNLNIHQNGRAGAKNVIIFLTDGRANVIQGSSTKVSETTAENAAIAEVKKSHKNDGTVFFTIGLGNNINASFLREIASLTGGKYYASPTTDQLNNIYDQISQIIAKGSVSGVVFGDTNENGVQDTDESGLSGWSIQLIKTGAPLVTRTTDTNGGYTFTGVCDGSYAVKQTLKSGWKQTLPADNNFYTINLANGNSLTAQNFGNSELPPPTPEPSCEMNTPTLEVTPDTQTGQSNETKTFQVKVTNNDSPTCQASTMDLSAVTNESDWDLSFALDQLNLTPGESKTTDLSVTPPSGGVNGPNTITVSSQRPNDPLISVNVRYILNNPDPTPEPTSTPEPTQTPSTTLNLIVGADGIGTTRKIPIGGNKNPLHPNRNLTVRLYNASTNQPAGIFSDRTFAYDGKIQKFWADLNLPDNFTSGSYNVYVEGPQFLRGQVPGSVAITQNTKGNTAAVELVTGDINKLDRSNNNIDLQDYNVLISCSIYSNDRTVCDLDSNYQQYSDLDDNGIVDEDDFTLWLKEIANQNGSQLPI